MKLRSIRILALTLVCLLLASAAAESSVCDTAEEYLSALLSAKSATQQGYPTTFDIGVSPALFDELCAGDDDALLHDLEIQAGMVEAHYGSFGSSISYRNSIFFDAALHASDLDSLLDAVAQGASECRASDRFYIVCTPELFSHITDDLWQEMIWLCRETTGMQLGSCYTGLLPVISVVPNAYYPGTRMANACATGNFSYLGADENRALEVARAWAAEIRPGSDADVARQIHDLICARVTYDENFSSVSPHTCIGALLQGRCVCDGYADCFYLLGKLSGLDVRMQLGIVPEGEQLPDSRNNHAWNMVRIDGAWRMVDVTWDDVGGSPRYDYFNLGRSEVPSTHSWNWAPAEWNNIG